MYLFFGLYPIFFGSGCRSPTPLSLVLVIQSCVNSLEVFPSLTSIVIVKKCGRNSDHPWVAFVLVAHADQCGPMWMISGAFESSKIVAAMAHWRSPEYSFFGQKNLVKASYGIQKLRDETESLVDNFPKIEVQEAHDLDMRAHRFIMVFSTLAAAAGATPWPFLEFFLLLGILRTMSMDLARTYGLVLRPSFQWQLLASFPKISAIFVTAIMLGSLLKITSNLRAVGGLINAIMISCYNTAMGSLLQEIFRRLRLRNAMGEVAFSDVCQAGSGSGCRASWGRILVLVWHVSRFC